MSEKQQPVLVYPQQVNPQDEMSLFDIVKILIKRKKIIFFNILFFAVIGLGKVFFTSSIYNYSTTIQMGHFSNPLENSESLIEPSKYYIQKINNELIPKINGYTKKTPHNLPANISLITNGNNKLTINSHAGKNETVIATLHQNAIKLLNDDHQFLFLIVEKNIKKKIKQIRAKIGALTDKRKNIEYLTLSSQLKQAQASIRKLDIRQKLMVKELTNLNQLKNLKNKQLISVSKQLNGFKEVNQNINSQNIKKTDNFLPKVMALTGIEKLSLKRIELESELQGSLLTKQNNLDIKKEQISFDKEIQQNQLILIKTKLFQAKQKNENQVDIHVEELKNLQILLENYSPTKQMTETTRSIKPVGRDKKVIFFSTLILGLLAGLVLVFIVEFFEKLKKEKK